MDTYLIEWLSILGRWAHVIAAIAWIGHAFLFHSFEHGLRAPEAGDAGPDVKGEMWMMHGGGFFRLQKTRVLPAAYTRPLKWFKWEAAATWLSGAFLLVVVFYLSGRSMLVDPRVADLSAGAAIAISVGSLVAGWVVYDLIWMTLGRRQPRVAAALTFAALAGAAYGLTHALSGRAAFLHLGAMMGTVMAANVWMRILPGSRAMVAALERGDEPDLSRGELGRQRSLHNGTMHFPVIFLMISNHFHALYGHEHAWLILILVVALGAGTRQVLYEGATHAAVWGALAVSAAGLIWLTAPRDDADDEPPPAVTSQHAGGGQASAPAAPAGEPIAYDGPTAVGAIRGAIRFDGDPPAPTRLELAGNCVGVRKGAVYDEQVVVDGGGLRNAFVWIRDGWQRWQVPPAPEAPVEVDQVGCIYTPRVVGARVRQPVAFVNSDPFLHNVRSVSDANRTFNVSMPAPGDRRVQTYRKPEVMVAIQCDVHPWMRAFVGVVPHPWFAVSGAGGAFSLDGVPPGDYTVEVWHEKYGTKTAAVTVAPGGEATLSLSFP